MAGVDQDWVNRADKDGVRKLFGAGETAIEEVGGEVSVVVCGGHFDGSSVLHWKREGKLFIADTFMSVPVRTRTAYLALDLGRFADRTPSLALKTLSISPIQRLILSCGRIRI